MSTRIRSSMHVQVVRRGTACLALAALASFGLVASGTPASAAFVGAKLGTSSFEIDADANLKVDTSGNTDWLNGTTLRSAFADLASGGGDDSFGNGTKEDTAVPSVVDGGIPPNKSDLKYFGVYQETTAAFAQYLHLYWSRVQDPSGTTNMDFEFNKSRTLTSNGVTPVRSENDLLITYDLSRGGSVPTLSKRTWDATNNMWRGSEPLTGDAIGSINSSTIPASEAGSIGMHSPRTFGEATLDLNAIFGSGCASFGSAYLKSRSSDSFTSALKDYIAPRPVNVSNCGSVPIHKTDDTGAALSGATFTLYTNATPFTAPRGAEDTVTNPALSCQTNASGDCTIANVPFGSYWVVETVTPANHDTAAEQAVSVAPGGNTPSGTLTFVNNRQRGSIIVRKVEGSTALANAGFTVSKTGFTSAAMTEYATGLFCLDNLLYGTYTVTESTVPPGYNGAAPQTFAVTAGSTCAGRLGNPVSTTVTADLTFTNSKTPGTINIAKTDDASNPLPGATFKLFVDEPTSAGFSTRGVYDELYDTTLAAGPTQTNSSGAIQWTNIAPGFYCAVETGTPTGYDLAAAQCFELGVGSTAGTGATVNRTFVDNRQHRIVVLVCHEGTDTLLPSSVTLAGAGGSTKTSLAAGSLTAAQQKVLCDTGGASFGNLSGHAQRSLTVTPGTH